MRTSTGSFSSTDRTARAQLNRGTVTAAKHSERTDGSAIIAGQGTEYYEVDSHQDYDGHFEVEEVIVSAFRVEAVELLQVKLHGEVEPKEKQYD